MGTQLVPGLQPGSPQSRETYGAAIGYSVAAPLALNRDDSLVLVAGIGNIFRGDDAFGVEVARRLLAKPLPERVRVVDFGIRGIDLAYALLDTYRSVLLIDTLQRGGTPGTLYLMDLKDVRTTPAMSPHAMAPAGALALASAMGAPLENIFLLGCEPESFGSETDGGGQLSEPVTASLGDAVAWAESFIARQL